ncbi:DUF2989 domain-containing protein [Photobacterium sagamiensis]|uniref:DUF2989 domain-containing protein n=1 Tax=Photobacterium sagamiensis TaxID=2910241 RepID=UPI003D12F5E0
MYPINLFSGYLKLTLLTVTVIALSGCYERHRTTDSLCEAYPSLCAELNVNDGQCKIQRTNLIWQRYNVLKSSADTAKFKELKLTYKYQICLEYAARIEPTELKERKSRRMSALIHSYDSIKRLNQELASSEDPKIIYYRWSQGDKKALRQFLLLEGSAKLETPELQLALATYYTGKDKEKTLQILSHALELYKENQPIKPEIILSLATISHQQGLAHHAYIWATVGGEFNLPVVKPETLAALYPMEDAEREALNIQAKKITKALEKGEFTADMVK